MVAFGLLVIGSPPNPAHAQEPFLIVLGTAQDGGYPQAGCAKECCRPAWQDFSQRRFVSCLAVVDPESNQRWMFDCTPDFRDQLRLLDGVAPSDSPVLLDGILPTHAHIGHYTGLMHLGREVLGAGAVPVYAMPRMKYFLESNGPWSQLVELKQIDVRRLSAGQRLTLNPRVVVTPIQVPHRDEFSETVGFKVEGPSRSVLYLPDIDKWERWELSVESVLAGVDLAFLDGTFMDQNELPGRDMAEIPHPLIRESLQRFAALPTKEKAKIRFIHLNHSNPALKAGSASQREIRRAGMGLAEQGARHRL